jgi:hypothetical protein
LKGGFIVESKQYEKKIKELIQQYKGKIDFFEKNMCLYGEPSEVFMGSIDVLSEVVGDLKRLINCE